MINFLAVVWFYVPCNITKQSTSFIYTLYFNFVIYKRERERGREEGYTFTSCNPANTQQYYLLLNFQHFTVARL